MRQSFPIIKLNLKNKALNSHLPARVPFRDSIEDTSTLNVATVRRTQVKNRAILKRSNLVKKVLETDNVRIPFRLRSANIGGSGSFLIDRFCECFGLHMSPGLSALFRTNPVTLRIWLVRFSPRRVWKYRESSTASVLISILVAVICLVHLIEKDREAILSAFFATSTCISCWKETNIVI